MLVARYDYLELDGMLVFIRKTSTSNHYCTYCILAWIYMRMIYIAWFIEKTQQPFWQQLLTTFKTIKVSSMFSQPYVPSPLCYHSPMFPQPYVPSALCSLSPMFPQPYVPSALCLHSLMFPQPYVHTALCSLSLMFPQPYVPSALCSLKDFSPN